jgi:sec-independent protein translocase protein TatA
MGDLLQPTHLVLIGILLLILFGAKRLPELGKGLGEGLKGFKDGIKGAPDAPQTPPASTTQQNSAAPSNPNPVEPK